MVIHFVMFLLLVAFTYRLWRCIKLGRKNFDSPWASMDDKMHLIDHMLGALLSSIGATSAAVILFIEMASHLVGTPAQLHSAINFCLCVMLFGVMYMSWHLEKEETPDHPFYHWKDKNAEDADPMFMKHYLK